MTKTSEIYSSDEAKILKPDAALNWCVRAGNEQSLSKDEYMYKKMFEAAQKNIKEIISYRGLEGNLPTEYALYQKTLSQCSTYNCRSLNSIGIARQLNGHERYTPTYDKKQAVDKITNAPSPAVNATATTPPVAPAMAASSELEKVDAAINAAWKALPAETRKAILPSQRAWIKEKDKCANEQCVIDMTKKRIDILQNLK